jgi:hypothetical protein
MEFGRFGTPESVVVDRGTENMKWTDRLLKRYNIWKITISPSHAAAHGEITQGHRPFAVSIPKLTLSSDEGKEILIEHSVHNESA